MLIRKRKKRKKGEKRKRRKKVLVLSCVLIRDDNNNNVTQQGSNTNVFKILRYLRFCPLWLKSKVGFYMVNIIGEGGLSILLAGTDESLTIGYPLDTIQLGILLKGQFLASQSTVV